MRHSTRCVAALALSITAAHVPAQSTPPSIRALTLLQPGDTTLDVLIERARLPVTVQVDSIGPDGCLILGSPTIATACARITLPSPLTADRTLVLRVLQGDAQPVMLPVMDLRGDFNGDGAIDLADVSAILTEVTGGGFDGAFNPLFGDVNGDSSLDVADAVSLLTHLFQGGPAPLPVDSGASLCPPGSSEAACIPLLIEALGDSFETARAEYAWLRLFAIGDAAVAPLIAAAASATPDQRHAGWAGFSSATSTIRTGARFSSAALALVESIRLGIPSRYSDLEFRDPGTGQPTDSTVQAGVVAAFQAWDAAFAGLPVADRPRPDLGALPAEFPSAHYGPFWPGVPPGFDGSPVPDSGTRQFTPIRWCRRGDVAGTHGTLGEVCWFVVAQRTTGPTVVKAYSCFSWVAGCRQDTWIQPLPGASNDDFVEDLGYDPGSASLTPPPGTGNMMLVYEVCPDGTRSPIHAVKQVGDKWQSKNGFEELWVDICDPEGFCDVWYPPRPGKTTEYVFYEPLT